MLTGDAPFTRVISTPWQESCTPTCGPRNSRHSRASGPVDIRVYTEGANPEYYAEPYDTIGSLWPAVTRILCDDVPPCRWLALTRQILAAGVTDSTDHRNLHKRRLSTLLFIKNWRLQKESRRRNYTTCCSLLFQYHYSILLYICQ